MNNQKKQPMLVGGSSLLVVFAVLCLTVFALLGFSTVLADQRLSNAGVEAMKDYYAADTQAEVILAQLRNGDEVEGVTEVNSVYSYICPVSKTQELQVEVRIDGMRWEILRWQTVSTVEWSQEETISVWDGK